MKKVVGYIRVSTAKQGEHGVSLQEQRSAIMRYAERQGLEITSCFEERQTAAKRGRPMFQQMLTLLRRRQAQGVVIHKIDRGARNLKDWADLAELIDCGTEVHFANEALDLHSRGGRLSADIQAVVAADYIRNLREETRKGFYGRLKQGLYPLPAPLGYEDCGKGKPKEPDPLRAPAVKRLFQLYATGRHSLADLRAEAARLGLTNRQGGSVTRTGLSVMLNNPFYFGVIRLRRTQETFAGRHPPLISKSLFDRVQAILHGRTPRRITVHGFLFRRLLTCKHCGLSLIGERQKGHVYYRCHTTDCPTTGLREETVEAAILSLLSRIRLTPREESYAARQLRELGAREKQEAADRAAALRLKRDQIQDRLRRLTDAFLDGVMDQRLFTERKESLLLEERDVAEALTQLERGFDSPTTRVSKFLELANTAYSLYESGNPDEKRELLTNVTSNFFVSGKDVVVEPHSPFRELEKRPSVLCGPPGRSRTLINALEERCSIR